MDIDTRLLRYFMAVVHEGGIMKAAEALHITQPTLSRQMMQLEDLFGAKLFGRGKNLTLTEAGLILRRRAEEILSLADLTASEINAHDEISGIVSIGLGAFMPTNLLPNILHSFREKYQCVNYELYTNSADYLRQSLDNGLLDFAFLLEPADLERYYFIRLNEKIRWGILMNSNSPLVNHSSITKQDILSLPLITSGRLSLHTEINNWLGNDIKHLNITAFYNIPANSFMLVRKGLAYALTLEGSAELLCSENLVFRPLEPELSMTSIFAWKKSASLTKAAGLFLKHFKQMYSGHVYA